jgi:molybdate transport system substrate-binding protein
MRGGLQLMILLLSVAAAACAGGEDRGGTGEDGRGEGGGGENARLLVMAASDLRDAFEILIPLFETRSGTRVDLILGSTGNLTSQIENGAPTDLFFSANEAFLDRVEARGLLEPGTRRVYAHGRLALVWREGTTPPPGVVEALVPGMEGPLALANPEHAPYGTAAREVLEALGVWEAVTPRVVLGENVAQALQFVETGNADVGLVALSLVREARARPHHVVPDSLHRPLRQAAGVIRGSRNPEGAGGLLEWVLSEEGQAILRRHGFEAPSPGVEG